MPYWATAISVGRLMTISLFPNGQNRFRTRLPVNYQRWQEEKASVIVSGLITDGDGNPLIGVNILVKGKSTGVVSDLYGRYQIEVTEGDRLEFRYVGYNSEERDREEGPGH